MIDLCGKGRIRYNAPSQTLIPVLVLLFLIISSSVYPAIMSSVENKETRIILEVMAQLKMLNTDTSDYHADMQISRSVTVPPSSPTSIAPSLSTTFSAASKESSSSQATDQQQDNEEDSKMDVTAINEGDLVHTIWEDDTAGNFDSDILYKRDGADFDPTTINFSNNAGSSLNPTIAVSGNNVHVVWADNAPGNYDILYRRSIDGGGTFGPTINLSNNAGSSSGPAIAVSGNNVHVVWHDDTPGNDDILYRRSTDGGASFTEPIKNLSSNAGQSVSPAIAVSGNSVHVVWQDNTPGNTDILYRRSINGGSTFPNIYIKNLSNNAGFSEIPEIAVSGNNVHVVWQDITPPGNFDIFYRRSTDGGASFTEPTKNLSSNTGVSRDAAIAVSGNNVHVVWHDSTPGNDILYRRSTDGGAGFTEPIKNLSSNAGFSSGPAIAVSGNNVYVVWGDNTPGNFDILFRTSANNGATFPAIITNLSTNTGDSSFPAIAVS